MTDRYHEERSKVKLILSRMIESGFDVAPPEWADDWSYADLEYVLANYEDSYITKYQKQGSDLTNLRK